MWVDGSSTTLYGNIPATTTCPGSIVLNLSALWSPFWKLTIYRKAQQFNQKKEKEMKKGKRKEEGRTYHSPLLDHPQSFCSIVLTNKQYKEKRCQSTTSNQVQIKAHQVQSTPSQNPSLNPYVKPNQAMTSSNISFFQVHTNPRRRNTNPR